jgi:hypothetical protein
MGSAFFRRIIGCRIISRSIAIGIILAKILVYRLLESQGSLIEELDSYFYRETLAEKEGDS